MDWIRVSIHLPGHPKTEEAASILKISETLLVGHLVRLWSYCLRFAPDGDLCRFTHGQIARAAKWEGDAETFIQALVCCGPGETPGFLEDDGLGLRIHDWDDYSEKLVKQSEKSTERSRRWRENQKKKKALDAERVANALRTGCERVANAPTNERTNETNVTNGDISSVGAPDDPPRDPVGHDGDNRDQAGKTGKEPGGSVTQDQSGQAAGAEQAAQPPGPARSEPELVMAHYNERFKGKWARPLTLTDGRSTKIRARLKRFSVADLCVAIDNIRGSPFHCGEDEKSGGQVYATPDFIFRSDEQVDKWLKLKPKEAPKESTPKPGPDDKRREMLTSLYEG